MITALDGLQLPPPVDLRFQAMRSILPSSVTPADTATCLAAVDLLEKSTELVDKLWQDTEYFKGEMKKLGIDTGQSCQCPV